MTACVVGLCPHSAFVIYEMRNRRNVRNVRKRNTDKGRNFLNKLVRLCKSLSVSLETMDPTEPSNLMDSNEDAASAPPDLNQDSAPPHSNPPIDPQPIMTESQRTRRQRDEEIVTDTIFHDKYFVLKIAIFTMTVPSMDSGLDCYQAYYWFQRGEYEIAAICLAFTLVPAAIAFILVFASFSDKLQRLDLVLKAAGKLSTST